jgi:hypothetical protein
VVGCCHHQGTSPPAPEPNHLPLRLSLTAFVDPTPLIEERIAAEVGPLRTALNQTTDPKDRKRLEREIRRRGRQVRMTIVLAPAAW